MKIVLIGAKGNLGRQLRQVFSKGNKIFSWDRDEIDIRDRDGVAMKIETIHPDIIINAAAYNAVDNCEESDDEYELALDLNARAIGHLADSALETGAVVIHFSTDYVFSGQENKEYAESDKPNPVNRYGQTKFLGEQELSKRIDQGLKYYLIRTSKLFGPKGESPVAKPNFFDIMLKSADKKKELDVVDSETSLFTYTPDLAKAVLALVEGGFEYGIYHIANSGPSTWHDAAKALFRLKKIKIKVNAIDSSEYPRPAKRPRYSVLNNTKLPPLRHYREALEEYLSQPDK